MYPQIQIINKTDNNLILALSTPNGDEIIKLNSPNMEFITGEGYQVLANETGTGTINPGAERPLFNQELLLGDSSNKKPEFLFTVVINQGSIQAPSTSGAFSLTTNLVSNTYILTISLTN